MLRLLLALPLLVAGIGAGSTVARVGPAAPVCAQAAYAHRVGLVVEHGDGQVVRRCVGFDTPTATALDVLQASGLELGISSYGGGLGTAICQIDNEPTTYPPGCFTTTGLYWVLFVSHAGGPWVNSDVGASNLTVHHWRRRRLSLRLADGCRPTASFSCGHLPDGDTVTGADADARTNSRFDSLAADRFLVVRCGDDAASIHHDPLDRTDRRGARSRDSRRHRGAGGLGAVIG